MNTKTKLLIGLAVLMALVLGAGGAVLVSGSDDDPDAILATRETTTSTEGATTTTTDAAPPAGKAASATTTTTKKVNPPAIPLADEPTFTSVSVPATYTCPSIGQETFAVSWTTQNATTVDIHTDLPHTFPGYPPSGTVNPLMACDDGDASMTVQFKANGPGGSGVAVRTVTRTF
jgi:hypothetical protein